MLTTLTKLKILVTNAFTNDTIDAYIVHCEDNIINLTDSEGSNNTFESSGLSESEEDTIPNNLVKKLE